MAIVSSVFWVLGFILSVVIAPQLRIWTWGPTMLCFALATAAALPAVWNEKRNKADTAIVFSGAVLAFWIAARAALSPVSELAQSDILLVAMAIATFVSFRSASRNPAAMKVLAAGIFLITTASLLVISRQIIHPGFSPVFPERPTPSWPPGFYGHYSYGASFLIAVAMILGGLSLHSRQHGRSSRILMGILAVASSTAIYFTTSRGAIVGICGGAIILFLYTLMVAKRDDQRWFGPAILAIPILLFVVGFLLFSAWKNAEVTRGYEFSVSGIFDNTVRLYLFGIAISCIQLHPLIGGGARSFSWECFRFWDYESMGQGANKPEHVHNELLQTATDYGIIGAAILIGFLILAIVIATLRIATARGNLSEKAKDGWRIAGLAGFTGLFIQSNFEGIFRIPPGAILLALCISAFCMGRSDRDPEGGKPWFRSAVLTIAAIGSILCLAIGGWKGTRASLLLWPVYFGSELGYETKIDAISRAIEVWPLFSLYQQRGMLYQQAAAVDPNEDTSRTFLILSLADFRKASDLHPFDPTSAIGSAIPLTALNKNADAEAEYARAIRLQGGMEAGFRAHLMFAKHLNKKGLSLYDTEDPSASLVAFELATKNIEEAFKLSWIISSEKQNLGFRVRIHENFGRALEDAGDYRRALEQYDFASSLPEGATSHYRAAILLGNLAVSAWEERKGSDALKLFLDARHRIGISPELPENVTSEKRDEWVEYLERSIGYLRAAKYEASEKVDF